MVNMWPATHYVPTGDPYFREQEQYECYLVAKRGPWQGFLEIGVLGKPRILRLAKAHPEEQVR